MAIITIAEVALVETISLEKEEQSVALLMSLTRKKLKKKVKLLKLLNNKKNKSPNSPKESPLTSTIEAKASRSAR